MKLLTAIGVGLLGLAASLGIAHAAYAPAPTVTIQPADITTITLPATLDTADGFARKAGETDPTPTIRKKLTTNRCPEWEDELAAIGLPPIFSRIMWRESNCIEDIVSKTRYTGEPDVGLLQIQGSWRTVTVNVCKVARTDVVEALRRADCNLRVAKYLYDNGGLGHWGF